EAPETAKALLKQRFRWTYGVLQACWKHKARLFHGGGGVLGWAILPAFAVYQFIVPFVAPAVDLLLLVSLVRGQALATAGYYLLFQEIDALVGFPESHGTAGAGLHNAAALLHAGRIAAVARKSLLPTYDVFDEGRYFDPAPAVTVAEIAGVRVGLSICEDLWNDKQFWRQRRY